MAGLPEGTGNLAFNTQSLDALRRQARQAPEQALRQAAQQFESVFMNMMMQSMREATPQDGLFDSEQTKMFTSMLDQQLAQNMASRGVGLADVMVRQLGRHLKPEAAQPATGPGESHLTAYQQQEVIRNSLPAAHLNGNEIGARRRP